MWKTCKNLFAIALALCLLLPALSVWADEEDFPGWITPEIEPRFAEPGTQSAPLLRAAPLPESYGFSRGEDGTLEVYGQTPVRNQGSNGACWAFSTFAAAEAGLLRAGVGAPDLSETHMIYSAIRYDNSGSDTGNAEQGYPTRLSQGGNILYAASYLMRGTKLGGTLAEADDPYVSSALPFRSVTETSARGEHRKYTVRNIPIITGKKKDIYDPSNPDNISAVEMAEIKRAVQSFGAVSTSIYWSTTGTNYNPKTGAYYASRQYAANHAVAVVGWNDAYSSENFLVTPPGDGAWLIKNSWGTGADKGEGGSGYYWVSYYDKRIGEWTYAIDGVTDFDPAASVYEYDYRLDDTLKGYDAYVVCFPANRVEQLTEVKIMLDSPAEFQISVCADYIPGDARELSMEDFSLVQTVRKENPGFYTIPLENPVIIAGEFFAVRVSFLSDAEETEIYSYKKDSFPRLDTETGSYSAVFAHRPEDEEWGLVRTSNISVPCIKAVTVPFEGIYIRNAQTDAGLLSVAVDSGTPIQATVVAASYLDGRMLKISSSSIMFTPGQNLAELALSLYEGQDCKVFLLDAASGQPLCPVWEGPS